MSLWSLHVIHPSPLGVPLLCCSPVDPVSAKDRGCGHWSGSQQQCNLESCGEGRLEWLSWACRVQNAACDRADCWEAGRGTEHSKLNSDKFSNSWKGQSLSPTPLCKPHWPHCSVVEGSHMFGVSYRNIPSNSWDWEQMLNTFTARNVCTKASPSLSMLSLTL